MGFDWAHARSMWGLPGYRVLQAEVAPPTPSGGASQGTWRDPLFRRFYQNLGAGDTEQDKWEEDIRSVGSVFNLTFLSIFSNNIIVHLP